MVHLAAPTAPRVGVTVSTKVGNSVERNRIKRWVREYVRRHKSDLPGGDVSVIARVGAATATHDEMDRELARLLARLGPRETVPR